MLNLIQQWTKREQQLQQSGLILIFLMIYYQLTNLKLVTYFQWIYLIIL